MCFLPSSSLYVQGLALVWHIVRAKQVYYMNEGFNISELIFLFPFEKWEY